MELDQVTGDMDDYYIFNHLPNRYLHQTWWQSLEYGDELALLASFERTELRVAKIILKLFRLTDGGKYKFNTKVEELLLLSEADISKLTTYIGLCFTADNISQNILKAEKTEFKKQLGNEAYLFAHNEAQSLRGSCNITESYVINVKGTLMKNQMIGLHVLGKTLVHTDKALKRRLILKLGKPYEQFIRGTSSLKALSSSQISCVSLVESVAQYLGFLDNLEQQEMTNETA